VSEVNGLRVTVLGSSNAIPRPRRACSAYLIEGAGRAILADLGSGSVGNLNAHRAAESIDAVVISHMHADHFLDIIPMRYALKYGPRTHDNKVALWLPRGGEKLLRHMVSAFVPESPHDFLEEVFDVGMYDSARGLQIGDLRISFSPTTHYLPTFALRCDCADASVTYSADTAPDERVVRLASETGVFLCEATLTDEERDSEPRGHSSAREAGRMAREAGVERLVITHYSAENAAADLESRARTEFSGKISVADDHAIFASGIRSEVRS
jgi:ribonuclease BN (tRNA processing enzyme)